MKLNADIVYEELKKHYTVKMMGNRSTSLSILRPEFYLDNKVDFLSNHLYLATVDHLPLHPKLQENVVLVVIGDAARLACYHEKCCMIVIRNKVDFFSVYQVIGNVFDLYAVWEQNLFDIFLDYADLQKIVDCSYSVFLRPIHVLDASFHFLAHTGTPDSDIVHGISSIDPALIGDYLSSFNLITDKHGATIITTADMAFLCVNLFDKKSIYIGCLYIEGHANEFQSGALALAEYLGHVIEHAIEKNPDIITDESTTLKSAMVNIVNEHPLTSTQKWKLNFYNHAKRYVCVALHRTSGFSGLPENYLCSAVENAFPGAYTFVKSGTIGCFLDISLLTDSSEDYHIILNHRLKNFSKETRTIAGISHSFSELYHSRTAFLQAEAAIENGMITNTSSELFYFRSYALMSMVINSIGDFPAEAYFSERLRNLIEHDKIASVSYIETLRVFLKNSSSFTHAAEELFIHRSTVVDRITRIERELQIDLKDPDIRLQLEIILKALEIEHMMQQINEEP